MPVSHQYGIYTLRRAAVRLPVKERKKWFRVIVNRNLKNTTESDDYQEIYIICLKCLMNVDSPKQNVSADFSLIIVVILLV